MKPMFELKTWALGGWCLVGVLTILLLVCASALRITEEHRVHWFQEYINQSKDITRSGCKVADAYDGRTFVYDCKWKPLDELAYGCGYFQNGSAVTGCHLLK